MKISNSKERIKELLMISGDNQAEMSRKVGLSKTTIGRYVKGTQEPNQEALVKIANAYRISPSWLLGYDTDMVEKTNKEIIKMLNMLNEPDKDIVIKLIMHLAERG